MNETSLKKELLDILACPQCKGNLNYQPDKGVLLCRSCSLIFEVKCGIPVLLIDQAKPFSS